MTPWYSPLQQKRSTYNESYVPYLHDLITPMHLFDGSVTDDIGYRKMISDKHIACNTQPKMQLGSLVRMPIIWFERHTTYLPAHTLCILLTQNNRPDQNVQICSAIFHVLQGVFDQFYQCTETINTWDVFTSHQEKMGVAVVKKWHHWIFLDLNGNSERLWIKCWKWKGKAEFI